MKEAKQNNAAVQQEKTDFTGNEKGSVNGNSNQLIIRTQPRTTTTPNMYDYLENDTCNEDTNMEQIWIVIGEPIIPSCFDKLLAGLLLRPSKRALGSPI
jgi:hypothetical protein